MPDVDLLDKPNGNHEEPVALSPDDTLSPHPVSVSDVAGKSTDEVAPPPEHVEGEIKDEAPAAKASSRTVATKPPGTSVKKVVSGRPALSKVNTPGVKPSPTASPVKKTPAPTTRASMPPPKPPAPTHTRRTSVLPSKVHPTADKKPSSSSAGTKSTLSSSVSKSPASAINKPPSRASMVSSPDPDTIKPPIRPRTSITETIKRTPPASRPSVGVSKPSLGTTAARPSRTQGFGSVSSLRDIKENGKLASKSNDDLQQKLDSVNEVLSAKETAITELESQVSETKSLLELALADIQEKRVRLEELEQAKVATEQQLVEARSNLQSLHDEQHADDSATLLESTKAELHEMKELLQSERGSVKALQTQIASLEAEITYAKSELEALRASSQLASSDAAAAAATEHQALLQARADLEAISVETSALKSAHAVAFGDLQSKLSAAELKAEKVERLEVELDALKKEKEDTVNRISELEIEVLEARDSVEEAEDVRTKAESKVKALADELSNLKVASEGALEDKEKTLLIRLDEVKREHETRAAKLQHERGELLSRLAALEGELVNGQAALEKANQEQRLIAEEHVVKSQKLEESNKLALDELNAELRRIRDELESQEEILASKVKVVEEEHEQRLQEAFREANAKHGVDLQTLRAESVASLERVTQFHETTIKDLKAEHVAVLEEQTGDLNKQISKLTVELKATRDDLTKSKAALGTSAQEFKSLEAQLEAAHATAEVLASSATPDRTEEVNTLTKELADAKSDLTALQEVLAATNESIADMSNRHTKVLEDATEARTTEMARLKKAHESELIKLVKEKSDLDRRLSDARSEISMLKATISTRPSTPVSARSHGHGRTGSGTVTKEEIQKMHEAHNLKMKDLEVDYEKKLKILREELKAASEEMKELESQVSQKTMEISYYEHDQEEANETITRLQEELEVIQAGRQ